jgi:hypothetical protein
MMHRQGKTLWAALTCTAVGIVAACGSAQAAPPPNGLWATVNICDTVSHPDQMGVRASMPGNRTRQRMYMRFHAQFYNATKKQWFNVKGSGVSGWVLVGSAKGKHRDGGYTFSFAAPPAGAPFVLRGVVDFQWRETRRTKSGGRRTVIVRTLHANTKGEHPSGGADPAGYSSGTCEIK